MSLFRAAATLAAATMVVAVAMTDPARAATQPTTVAVDGTLQVIAIDSFGDRPRADHLYTLVTDDGATIPIDLDGDVAANSRFSGELVVAGDVASALDAADLLPRTGTTIAEDTRAGRVAVAAAADQEAPLTVADVTVAPVTSATVPAPAAHRAYVAKMTDQGAVDGTNADIGARVDAMLAYWTTESGGAITSFTRQGAILDYDSAANVPTSNGCGMKTPSTMWSDAAGLFPGVSFSDPGNHLIVLVGDECGISGPAGVARVGESIADGGPSTLTYDPETFASTGAHELGHNFGLGHANLHDCPSVDICEYWDLYSPMGLAIGGATWTPPALGTLFRSQLGLTSSAEVTTVGAGGARVEQTYALAPRGSSSGTRSLLVTDPATGTTYSVDYRSRTARDAGTFYGNTNGYDFGGAYPAYPTGVVIERHDGGGETHLITRTVAGRQTGAFAAGSTFSPSADLSIAVGSTGATASVTVTVGAEPAPPAVASSVPTISGSATVGRTVTAVPGTWTSGATFAYAWKAGGVPIAAGSGGTSKTLTVPASAAGRQLTVAVTGSAPGFSSVTRTSAGVVVARGTLTTVKPRISGTVKVGRTLTVTRGTWTPTPSLTQRWYADGARISGATGRTFKLTTKQRGKRITVKVTGRKTGYSTASRTSARTSRVAR